MEDYKRLINVITLFQNSALIDLRSQASLTKLEVQVICYADRYELFNSYQLRTFFKNVSPQQLTRVIKKLEGLSVLEMVRRGVKGKSAVFMLTVLGKRYLEYYYSTIEKLLD